MQVYRHKLQILFAYVQKMLYLCTKFSYSMQKNITTLKTEVI